MVEIRKLQRFGGSRALTLPSGWLAMIEADYKHEITSVELEDLGPSLKVTPCYDYRFDALKYEVIEDAFGVRQLARPTINMHNPLFPELLDHVTRAGGRIVIDNIEYSLVHTDNDLGYGKTERVLIGISRQRLPRKA